MISADVALPGTYDYGEVARSVLIAIFVSYAALDLSGRVNAARGRVRLAWLGGGAIAMGIGIWAMHFKGMLAFHLPVPVEYHWPTVLASLLVAVLASAVALYVSSRHRMSSVDALTGSIFMGAGIAGLHYLCMAAMRLPAITRFSPILVTCSILLAILFSLIALLMAFGLREETRWSVPRRLGSATVLGVAVSAMHYTGMAAATFIPASPPDLSYAVSVPPLGNSGVVVAAMIVLLAAVTTSSVDRQQAREQLRLVVDTTPAMLYTARPDGSIDFFNKRWLEFVGLSLDDLCGQRWTAAVHPDDLDDLVHKWRSALASGEPNETEARVRRADGVYRLMLLRKVPLRDDAGNIVKWYGSGTDIEDRKQAEEEFKVSEEKHRVIVEAASDAVISMDESGSILLSNPATARIFGYGPIELIGKPVTVLMPEFIRKLHEASFGRYLAGQRHLRWQGAEIIALRKNGEEFPVEVSFGEMTCNGHKLFAGFIRDISEKKRAENELLKQKEVLQKIFENIPVLITFRGKDRELQLVNPEWERTTGWKLEEIREQNPDILADFFPDPHYRQVIRDLIAASTGQWSDIRLRARDGRVIDLASTFVHLSDGSTLGIGQDITERKRSEEALRSSERRQHRIAKQLEGERARLIEAQAVAKVGSWEVALPSLAITWSEQTHRIFETDPSHFHPGRQDFVKFIHPEDRAKVDEAFQASLDNGAPSNVEYRTVMADGRVKVLEEEWRVFHDEQGRPIRLMGTCRDVTERRLAEAELRESEARFRLVADSAPVMIWMSGRDKLCTYFNKPWLDFTGRSIDQELGNGWAEGVDPEDLQRCLDSYTQAFDRREAFRMEYRLRRHDGEFRWVLDIGAPRFNPDGSFAGYIGSCIDVTEQRRSDEQLRQVQEDLARVTRVVAMGELAAAIAHEVNQPLTAIVTNANFCLRRLDGATSKPDELRAAITAIASDGTRASAVISRIRGLLTKEAPNRTELDINQIIKDVTILLRNEFTRNRVSLRADLASDLPQVPGDPVLLQQVLINLIMNAIEATRTSTSGRREILIRSAKNPDDVLVQVQDSGPGIAPELGDRIFEPFFTTKAKGIGMGLSISRSILESHGGQLSLVPASQGALFQFILPVDRSEAA